MQQQFTAWYDSQFAWLNETATILQVQDDHLLVHRFGYRFTIFRQVGGGFKEVFDGGSDRAKAEAELLRRKDPSFYWSITQKIQNFTDKGLVDFALAQYKRIESLARGWNLDAARMRSQLKGLERLTIAEMEAQAQESFQSIPTAN